MQFRRVSFDTEKHGSEPVGEFFAGDVLELIPSIVSAYGGQVKCVYMDPPFQTGKQFEMRQRVGEAEWKSGKGSLTVNIFKDRQDADDYLSMMRKVLTASRELLREDGMIFVHIDYRTHARIRLMMDEIFGESNFLNEIIWSYSTGGRSKTHFSRKHDIILFYRKSEAYDFDAEAVAVERQDNRRNHMKQHVDADGRIYRSINVGGKIYTYYDDERVPPGDVWTDLSHLQQKDPQRTGYDTQKPLKLLERIIGCSTKPGELVFDPFTGSGTTLQAAYQMGRRFLGCDISPMALQTTRRRLEGAPALYHVYASEGEPSIDMTCTKGVGLYNIELNGFTAEDTAFADRLDAVDSWAAGYREDGVFRVYDESVRSWKNPQLNDTLSLPVYKEAPIVRISDVLGRDYYYEFGIDE